MSSKSESIKAIDKTSVHKICSGQVILTLATAIKELIENSLDAGSTNIDIKLKGFGEDSIEVADNGVGIQPENFHAIALKHNTSKLKEFSDLIGVQTFGFRGEALSSLSALSDLSISTRHGSNENGTKIDFDRNGNISSQAPCARQVGTTVMLKNLFKPLPVRHKEFVKNIKREFTKMSQILYSYCLIRPDVKFFCNNLTSNSKRNIVVQTVGNQDLFGTITNIFGHSQVKSLKIFKQVKPNEVLLGEFGLLPNCNSTEIFNINGYVSVSEHGMGRSTTDRQFYFINKRPCDNSKMSRIVNEIYHQYNRHQYPFVFLNISFLKESVDVNVTPDKRQIFVENEKLMLATLKMSLMKMYSESSAGEQCTSLQSQTKVLEESFRTKMFASSVHSGQQISFNKLKRQFSHKNSEITDPTPKQTKLETFNWQKKLRCESPRTPDVSTSTPQVKHFDLDLKPMYKSNYQKKDLESSVANTSFDSDIHQKSSCKINDQKIGYESSVADLPLDANNMFPNKDSPLLQGDYLPCENNTEHTAEKISNVPINPVSNLTCTNFNGDKQQTTTRFDGDEQRTTNANKSSQSACTEVESKDREYIAVDESEDVNKKTVKVDITLDKIVQLCQLQEKNRKESDSINGLKFKAKITPEDSKTAEDELKKAISKDMFSQMEVLFQFNLGFIIAKLNSDLFIIDQHASDEKYNFEMLQRNAHLQTQKLISPQPLNLTFVNESILKDNIEIFQKNGFEFEFGEDGKANLVSIPVNKNWSFGKEDIDELIFMLSDSPGVMCRPSRVQQMFASQSCRKSVMIGTGLTKANMGKMLKHMGEIEQPWNCPHGRPTIRHLINLDLLHSS